MSNNRKTVLRVGIAGKRGLSLVSGFRALEGRAEIAVFCDPDRTVCEQAAASQYGITRTVERFTDLLNTSVHAVVIATPIPYA